MKSIPEKPDLDYLKKEAKQLRTLHRNADVSCCDRIRHFDTVYSDKTDAEIFSSKFSILDAQRITAREYGFSSWAKLKRCIESMHKNFNAALHEELIHMKDRDAEIRQKLLDEGVLYDAYHPEMEKVHNEHAERLKAIIAEHGWPGTSMVGIDGCRAAWRIAQFAISQPEFQKQSLKLLQAAVEEGEAPSRMLAFLTDIILFHSNKPQKYGAIADWDDDGHLTYGEVEDEDKLDQRRGLVGLGPIGPELVAHEQEVKKEGRRPPEDLEKYKQKAEAWAKRVGWK
ncbi:MAG: hypothetical protein OEZ33_03635 [Gammaproteobacteria bacterium]|nr:hypothetical protein [Gammaproteobacteria bacterium]